MLDVVPVGVVVADAAGRVEFRNLAATEFDGSHTGALIDAAVRQQQAVLLAATETVRGSSGDGSGASSIEHGANNNQADGQEAPGDGTPIMGGDTPAGASSREVGPADQPIGEAPGAVTGAANQDGAAAADRTARRVGRTIEGRSSSEDARTVEERIEFFGPPRLVLRVVSTRLDHTDGAPARVVSLVIDVSETDRLDRVRTDFVANVSHELKTPLGALTLLIDAIDGEGDEVTRDRLIARMQTEVSRANRMVARLVELSEIESGSAIGDDTLVVDEIVARAVARVSERARHRGVTINTEDHSTEGAVLVRGVADQLESAVVNLLENAVVYSEKGAVVDVWVAPDRRSGTVAIEVVDRGIGIPRSEHERIFERFYRVDRGRSRQTGGNGLGLAIVRRTALAHGGDVELDSTEGEGSRFTLRLPMLAGPRQPQEHR